MWFLIRDTHESIDRLVKSVFTALTSVFHSCIFFYSCFVQNVIIGGCWASLRSSVSRALKITLMKSWKHFQDLLISFVHQKKHIVSIQRFSDILRCTMIYATSIPTFCFSIFERSPAIHAHTNAPHIYSNGLYLFFIMESFLRKCVCLPRPEEAARAGSF